MPSGKFVLRLDPKVHQALKKEAKARGESLNSVCCRKLGSQESSEWAGLTSQIVEKFSPVGIVLFGSMARGEATKNSDVDLLIAMPESVAITRDLYRRWDEVFKSLGEKYSPQFAHLPKTDEVIGSLWLEIALDGDILFEKNKNLKQILLKIRSQIAEGQYLRKVSYGNSYWIRQKHDAK